jgi:hypothetical protein
MEAAITARVRDPGAIRTADQRREMQIADAQFRQGWEAAAAFLREPLREAAEALRAELPDRVTADALSYADLEALLNKIDVTLDDGLSG